MEDTTAEVELAHSCFIGAYLNINRHSPTPALWRPINLDVYLSGTEQEPKEQCCCGSFVGVSAHGFFDHQLTTERLEAICLDLVTAPLHSRKRTFAILFASPLIQKVQGMRAVLMGGSQNTCRRTQLLFDCLGPALHCRSSRFCSSIILQICRAPPVSPSQRTFRSSLF